MSNILNVYFVQSLRNFARITRYISSYLWMRCEPSSLHGGRQSGNSKRFDVYQNCSLFTEVRGKEEKEGQVDILQNAKFVFYLEFLEFVTTEKNRC